MKKVTKEIKQTMTELRSKGISFAGIGRILGLSSSTVQYHIREDQRQKAIKRSIKNRKIWAGSKEYNKKYQSERYNNDTKFRERVKTDNRENWRRKHGKSNNIS